MKKIFIIVLAFLCFGAKPLDKKKIKANNAISTFKYGLHHPLHSFEAESKTYNCVAAFNTETNQIEAVALMAAIESFDSGNSNRDSHMIETVKGLEYPNVTFSADQLAYEGDLVTAKGFLVFHGEKKPITIQAKQLLKSGQLTITGGFEVDMTAHGIKPPSLMGMSTDDEIKFSFELKFDI